jgi:hypothetical protein
MAIYPVAGGAIKTAAAVNQVASVSRRKTQISLAYQGNWKFCMITELNILNGVTIPYFGLCLYSIFYTIFIFIH